MQPPRFEFALIVDGEVIGHMRRANKLPTDRRVMVVLPPSVKAEAVRLQDLSEDDQRRALRTTYSYDGSQYKRDL